MSSSSVFRNIFAVYCTCSLIFSFFLAWQMMKNLPRPQLMHSSNNIDNSKSSPTSAAAAALISSELLEMDCNLPRLFAMTTARLVPNSDSDRICSPRSIESILVLPFGKNPTTSRDIVIEEYFKLGMNTSQSHLEILFPTVVAVGDYNQTSGFGSVTLTNIYKIRSVDKYQAEGDVQFTLAVLQPNLDEDENEIQLICRPFLNNERNFNHLDRLLRTYVTESCNLFMMIKSTQTMIPHSTQLSYYLRLQKYDDPQYFISICSIPAFFMSFVGLVTICVMYLRYREQIRLIHELEGRMRIMGRVVLRLRRFANRRRNG